MADPKSPYSVMADNDSVLASGATSLAIANRQGVGPSGEPEAAGAFNVFRYPSDLGSDQHPHYLMFFITVRESDIRGLQMEQAAGVQFDFSQNNTGINKSAAMAQTMTGITGGVVGGTMGGMAGAGVADATGLGKLAGTAATVIGVAGGAFVGAKIANELGDKAFQTKQKDQITLKTAIALYMTGKPSVQYQANWADENIGIVGGLSTEVLSKIDTGNLSSMENIKSAMGGVGGGMASFILSKAESSGPSAVGNVGAAFSAAAGITANPFRAQLFKSMGFRKFSYEYAFLPKNFSEYNETQNIIHAFKRYMHPIFGASKFILNYPAEFTIAYFHKADRNKALYKISNCALTNLSVEYGGTDFTTFKETPGYPTEIAMKLEFTELEVLTRERIEVGY